MSTPRIWTNEPNKKIMLIHYCSQKYKVLKKEQFQFPIWLTAKRTKKHQQIQCEKNLENETKPSQSHDGDMAWKNNH